MSRSAHSEVEDVLTFQEWERTILSVHAESMVHIRDTSYFMSLYQEGGQEYGLCGASETAN